MSFVNLTPHEVIVRRSEGDIRIPPSGVVARVATREVDVGSHLGVPLVSAQLDGAPEGVPDPKIGTILIVSRIVFEAVPNREDLAVPHDLVRDSEGKVVGCRALCVR